MSKGVRRFSVFTICIQYIPVRLKFKINHQISRWTFILTKL